MIRTYIIEDEEHTRDALVNILTTHCKSVHVVGTADDVTKALEEINLYKPDLVLADIAILGGTCFDVFEKLDETDFKIIIITAHAEYALKAIKFSAIEYLIKPIDPLELVTAIQKVSESLQKENTQMLLKNLITNIRTPEKKFEQIVLKTAESIYLVNLKEIMHIEADGSYTRFYFQDGRKIVVSKVIKEYDEMLSGVDFLRVHQSHLINLNYVDRFEKQDGGYLVLKNKAIIPVSYRKKESLLKVLEKIGKSPM